jgi:ABC-type nitrate/sulfonate/bicarbonate transport system substrate-binding protein
LAIAIFAGSTQFAVAQQLFSELVGNVRPQPVKEGPVLNVPFITWGGDVATFHANGGLNTKSDSLFGKSGLNIKLTPGDDFIQQVTSYLAGETPFLRGTMRMLGQASEVLGATPGSKPVVILQLSWSAGDHIVGRENIRSLNDLKGKDRKIRIACQQGGPHVGLLYDSLDAAQIARNDVEIVWVKDLTGADGPAEAFRKDATIDACCVITPDMLGLTGGFDTAGTGAEGTVQGAHVVNSTQQMSRSIADVYAVRSDWYESHKEVVEKFVAGYLKGAEEVVAMRKSFNDTNKLTTEYRNTLKMAQDIFGSEVLPTLEVDAHGLLLDCTFVGLAGQASFFEDKGNPSGFEPKTKAALDMAVGWGYAKSRKGFDPPGLNYDQIATLAKIEFKRPTGTQQRIDAEMIDISPEAQLDGNTIVSFTISFEPNQSDFSSDRYGTEFSHAIQQASLFGNAVVVIRGHADPTRTLREMLAAGMKKGTIKQQGQPGNYRYYLNGKLLNVENMHELAEMIKTGQFEGTEHRPRETMQAALNLSLSRAQQVKDELVAYAKKQGVNLDVSQMQPAGAGILEPVVAKPKNLDEAKQNMRVEFRIVRVPAEALKASDFDF